KQDLPPEAHYLVVAEAWQSPADPHKEEDQEEDFENKPKGRKDTAKNPFGPWVGYPGEEVPTTEEEDRKYAGANDDVGVLSHEEKTELEATVFRIVSGYQLGFSFGHIERQAVGLR